MVIPMIRRYEEALYAVRSFLYPPEGVWGYGPQCACRYGLKSREKYSEGERQIVCILQVEHIDAINDLDRMLSIPEIDVLLLLVFFEYSMPQYLIRLCISSQMIKSNSESRNALFEISMPNR